MRGRPLLAVAITVVVLVLAGLAAYGLLHGQSRPAGAAGATRAPSTASPKSGFSAGQANLTIAMGDWGPPSPFLFYPRGPGYVLTSLVFDTLVWKDSRGIVPWLAVSWEHPDEYTWVFHLRRGVYWQDGVPLTARDVVFTFKYLEEHGWTWKNINPSLISTVKAEGNYTVVIRLAKPYAFFLEDYASTVFILPEHIWRNVSNPYSFRGRGAFIGSGPYMLVKYEPGKGYLFKANPHFWGGTPRFRYIRVIATSFTNPQQEAAAIISGQADTAVFMGKAYRLVRMIKERVAGVRVTSGPMYWVLFLGFNLEKWPYNTTTFRRAIAYSLNLTELVLRVAGSLKAALPGSPGYIPPYSSFYNPNITRYPYNPQKAEELLDGLGLRDLDGDGCRDLPNGSQWRPLLVAPSWYTQDALVIKDMLSRVGVCVDIKTVQSFNQLDSIIRKGLYDLEINGHGAAGNTPTAFTWYFSGRFGSKWDNPSYWSIVAHIVNSTSQDEAYHYAEEAQALIASELPRIALYYPNIFVVTRPGVPVEWFFTHNGIDGGIPLPYNKIALITGP